MLVVAGLALAGCGSDDTAAPAAGAEPSRAPAPASTPAPAPVVTVESVTVTEAVAFQTVSVDDATMEAGTSAVTTAGVDGVRTLTYEVTLTDRVETSRVLVGDEVTTAPVDEVTSVGTYEPPPPPPKPEPKPEPEPEVEAAAPRGCDPNYSGCVPVDSDVDCAGGSGNGPSYADGPVTVTGTDIYGLDADDDGVGCE